MEPDTQDPLEVVRRHIRAFNAHDLDGLMACFSADATWTTGTESLRGAGQLKELFVAAFRELCPELHVQSILAQGDQVACELREDFVVGGSERSEYIAGFYRVANGRITAGKIYREGSAEA